MHDSSRASPAKQCAISAELEEARPCYCQRLLLFGRLLATNPSPVHRSTLGDYTGVSRAAAEQGLFRTDTGLDLMVRRRGRTAARFSASDAVRPARMNVGGMSQAMEALAISAACRGWRIFVRRSLPS